jgi:hypothetical protein
MRRRTCDACTGIPATCTRYSRRAQVCPLPRADVYETRGPLALSHAEGDASHADLDLTHAHEHPSRGSPDLPTRDRAMTAGSSPSIAEQRASRRRGRSLTAERRTTSTERNRRPLRSATQRLAESTRQLRESRSGAILLREGARSLTGASVAGHCRLRGVRECVSALLRNVPRALRTLTVALRTCPRRARVVTGRLAGVCREPDCRTVDVAP